MAYRSPDNRVTICFVASLSAALTIAVGCASRSPSAGVEATKAVSAPQTQPAAAPRAVVRRPRRVDLFGVSPARLEVPFEGRAAGALQQHSFAEVGGDFDADVDAPAERIVFASTRHSERPNLYLKSTTGRAVTQLTADPASDVQPVFSPDGSRIAFVSDRAGSWDIWILEIEAGRPVQVTRDEGHEVHPAWAPDGERLVFSRITERGRSWELWVMDLRGPAKRRFIGQGLFPQWSPVAETIAFQRARERGSRWFSIWTIELVDGEPHRPTEIVSAPNHALIAPTWSPDGKRLSYCSVAGITEARADTGEGEATGVASDADAESIDLPSDVWIVDADGRSPIRLTDGSGSNYSPAWASDGRVYFVSGRDGRENIWSVRPVTASLLASGPARPRQVRPAAHQLPASPAPARETAPVPAAPQRQPAAPQPQPVALPVLPERPNTRSGNLTEAPARADTAGNAQSLPPGRALALPAVNTPASGS